MTRLTLTGVRRRRGNRLLVFSFVMAAGLVAGLVTWQLWPNDCGGVFSGMHLNDGECIGIADGSHLFNDPSEASNSEDRRTIEKINEIQRNIESVNTTVAREARYVKVVLLAPLTVSHVRPSATSLKQILHSLQGSYTGLMRANNSADFGDPSVERLQLLLVNEGSQQEAGNDFLDDIMKMSEPGHPVVAVIGLGVSFPSTKITAEYFARRQVPMVSAVASADDLTNLPLLWSVEPGNREFVQKLGSLLDGQHVLKSGLIVYDQNDDLFTRSLKDAYHAELGRYLKFPDQPFRGSTLPSPGAPNVFGPVVTNLCNAANALSAPLDMVFYAGRLADFRLFAEALNGANRTCRGQQLTVLTASTGFTIAPDQAALLKSAHVAVVYAATSDSVAWGKNEAEVPSGYAAFLAAYHANRFLDDADLTDGYVIAHHDALVTTARAIRLAAGASLDAPTPQDVITNGFGHLSLAYTVPAASGTLTFPPEGGRAIGKLIPIKQVR